MTLTDSWPSWPAESSPPPRMSRPVSSGKFGAIAEPDGLPPPRPPCDRRPTTAVLVPSGSRPPQEVPRRCGARERSTSRMRSPRRRNSGQVWFVRDLRDGCVLSFAHRIALARIPVSAVTTYPRIAGCNSRHRRSFASSPHPTRFNRHISASDTAPHRPDAIGRSLPTSAVNARLLGVRS